MNNPSGQKANVTLSTIGGLCVETDDTDLPEGASPRNWDMDYLIGSALTRPGLSSVFTYDGLAVGPNNPSTASDRVITNVPWKNVGNLLLNNGTFTSVTPAALNIPTLTPNTGVNATATHPWASPQNIGSASLTTTVTLPASTHSTFLHARQFNFNLPAGATVQGIVVSLRASSTVAGSLKVQILKGSAEVGTIQTLVTSATPTTIITGASGFLWGTTFAPTDVNSAGFGVSITADAGAAATFTLNNCQVTVYYRSANTSDALITGGFSFNVTDAGITGIQATVTGFQTAGLGTVNAQLLKAGAPVGVAKTIALPASTAPIVLGSSNDLWSTSFDAADVNNSQFGLELTATSAAGVTFFVSEVDLTVFETETLSNFNYVKSFSEQVNQFTLALDAVGNIWQENVLTNPGFLTSIFTGIQPNSYCKSVTQFSREYMCFSNLQNGTDVPRQYDGTQFDRISQVGPGAAPSVSFTQNGVTIVATPNGIKQNAAVTVPTTAGGNHSWLLWSSGPSSTAAGNVLTFIFPSAFTLPAGFAIGQNVVIAGADTMNGYDPNNGSGSNPAFYTIISLGQPIPGQQTYDGFSVHLPQSGAYNAQTANPYTVQQTLATVFTTTQVSNLQVGGQFTIAGAGVSDWDGTWTVVGTPNASQMAITDTSLTGNVATYTFVLSSGSTPTTGELVTVTGTFNGNGIFNVVNATITGVVGSTFTVTINNANVSSAAETGAAIINGSAFQFDPEAIFSNSGGGSLVTAGNISAGERQCVCLFLTRNGFISPPSPIVKFSTTSASVVNLANIPTGPPDVIARILAFTGANGGNFFYIPINVTITSNGQPIVNSATVINDNVTTTATFSFSDAVLLAASAIDIQGNNTFNQKELGSSIWNISYADRMIYGLEQNKIQNLINWSFDGGVGNNSSVGGGGTVTTTYPLGWTVDPVNGNGGSVLVSPIFGNSYYIKNSSGSTQATYGEIFQGAYQDSFQVPIFLPFTQYSLRLAARCPSGLTTGSLVIDLFSPSTGLVYGSFVLPFVSMTTSMNIFTASLLSTPFTTPTGTGSVPQDLLLRLYASGIGNGADVEIDRIEPFPTDQPTLTTQVQCSYVNNPEAFDGVTGLIGLSSQNQQPVYGGFVNYDLLYFLKSGSMYSTQDNGTTEPSGWSVREVSNKVGTCGPLAYDYGEEWMVTMSGPAGLYLFNGGEPIKMSQELQPIIDAINWTYGYKIWVKNDIVNRRILIGVPLPTGPTTPAFAWLPTAPVNLNPTSPNVILMCNYKELNTSLALATSTPMHISYSGKLIAWDMSRKWSIWNIASPGGDFIVRPDTTQPLFLGNGIASSKIYQFLQSQKSDDGVAISSYYSTYGWFAPDAEQQYQPVLGSFIKRYIYMSVLAEGVGSMSMTQTRNSIFSGKSTTSTPQVLQSPLDWEIERPLNNMAQRLFLAFSTNAVNSWFELSKITLTARKDAYTPVRGIN